MRRVIDFLKAVGENNNREWFGAHKEQYREAEAMFGAFGERLIAQVGEFDPAVRGLTLRDCTYRIYRDTRFSHDKTPYKTHMGLYICPGGKKSGNAGYYFHMEPGNCLLDAGVYMPSPAVLRSVRDEIFDNGEALMAAVFEAGSAGWELDRSNSLKRTPTGYPVGSEWDEYLKLKDLHLSRRIDEEYVCAADAAERAAEDFRATYDFMSLVQRAVQFAHEEG